MKKQKTPEKEIAPEKEYSPRTIFTYSTEHLLKKDKIRFHYAMKGRDGKTGIAKAYDIKQLGRAVIIAPDKNAEQVENFFNQWKCEYNRRNILVKKKK